MCLDIYLYTYLQIYMQTVYVPCQYTFFTRTYINSSTYIHTHIHITYIYTCVYTCIYKSGPDPSTLNPEP
jgi:hypothetical protein